MSRNLRMASMMASAAILVESSGPVRVKAGVLGEHSSMAALLEAEREGRRRRNAARLAQEEEDARLARALTSDAEWSRIERDEKRRADKKAAKKATKK